MSLDSDVRIDCWPANMDSQLVSHDFRHHLTSAREHVRSHGGNDFDATVWDAFLFRPRWMLVHSKFKLLLNCRSTDVRRELIQQKISYGMMHLIYNKRMKKNRNHQSLENTFYNSVEAFFKSPGLKCELQDVFQKHQSLPFFKVVKSGCLKLLRNPLQLLDYVCHTVLALLFTVNLILQTHCSPYCQICVIIKPLSSCIVLQKFHNWEWHCSCIIYFNFEMKRKDEESFLILRWIIYSTEYSCIFVGIFYLFSISVV